MKRPLSLLIALLFTFSLAFAVSIELQTTDYMQGEMLIVRIEGCSAGSALQIYNANLPGDLIYLSQGEGDWQATYNTNSDPSDGRYQLFASCDDATTAQHSFCVDAPGCTVTNAATSGGSSCTSNWRCPTSWSYCNATLEQSKTCTDLNRCDQRKFTKMEAQACAACEESWICTPWNSCQNGQQTRSCIDEHSCKTTTQKPLLQKNCLAAESGPAPALVQPQLPVLQQPLVIPQPSSWKIYGRVLAGSVALLLASIGIGIYIHHKRNKVE